MMMSPCFHSTRLPFYCPHQLPSPAPIPHSLQSCNRQTIPNNTARYTHALIIVPRLNSFYSPNWQQFIMHRATKLLLFSIEKQFLFLLKRRRFQKLFIGVFQVVSRDSRDMRSVFSFRSSSMLKLSIWSCFRQVWAFTELRESKTRTTRKMRRQISWRFLLRSSSMLANDVIDFIRSAST